MLTLEEAELVLRSIKLFSTLCILPIQVDVKSGKIQRQSSKGKVFISKMLFGICILHWLYMFGRLIQSTVVEPEKYFRWDHFILHFPCAFAAAVIYFTGFRLFVKKPEENVIMFNELFAEREDSVQKMIKQFEIQREKGNENKNESGKRGNRTPGKPGTGSGSENGLSGQNQKEVNEYKSKSKSGPRPLLTWPLQYSLDELLAKLITVTTGFSSFCAVPILALDPSRPQLLYSCLPSEYKNVSSFLPLLAVEGLCMAINCSIGSIAIGTQVLFFSKCHSELGRMSFQLRNLREKIQNEALGIGGRDIRREIWTLRQILKEMKELAVLIELFNRCFPFCIFAWKIFSLSTCILCYFFAIRHTEQFPILGFFLAYSAGVLTVIYTIMYEHAFSIPGKMEDLKKEFLLTAQKTTSASASNSNFNNKNLLAEMKREMKRIRGVGVKVGSFHQMERESTPNFVNFVINQVVTLLVTIPR